MTTGPNENRLDRIEAAIERQQEQINALFNRQESRSAEIDRQIADLSSHQESRSAEIDRQIAALFNYLDADRIRQEKFKADVQADIREGFETAGSLIADLAVQVGAVTQRIDRMAEQADRDRQDWQERIEQIWVYLRSKDRNGHSNGGSQ